MTQKGNFTMTNSAAAVEKRKEIFMKYKIEFDRDYGIDKRTGWSICVDGHYIIQLEKHFLMALIKAVGKIIK